MILKHRLLCLRMVTRLGSRDFILSLTYLRRIDLTTLISRTSSFLILGGLVVFFMFFFQILIQLSVSKQ